MTEPIEIRPACAGDVPGILALERAVAEAPHWTEAAYTNYFTYADEQMQSRALFVALQSDRVYGFAVSSCVAGEAELESIAVAVPMRRSGLGGRLLRTVMNWAQQRYASGLLLEVRSANTGAQAFYRAFGFRAIGMRPKYYSSPVDDAVLLRWDAAADHNAKEPAEQREL